MPLTIALHHGILATDELRLGPLRYTQFPGIPAALHAAGHRAFLTRAHPTASIPRRAEQLKQSLLRQLPNDDSRILLIAHSLGGLDARYMLTHLGMSDRVAALLTISTPHHGASLADFFHLNLHRRLPLYRTLTTLGLDIGAAHGLTREAMTTFNTTTPDHSAVAYFSITCAIPPGMLRPKYALTHRFIAREEGPNDGVVAATSARWGTHLAHWDVDHINAINRFPPLVPAARRLSIPTRYLEAIATINNNLNRATASAK